MNSQFFPGSPSSSQGGSEQDQQRDTFLSSKLSPHPRVTVSTDSDNNQTPNPSTLSSLSASSYSFNNKLSGSLKSKGRSRSGSLGGLKQKIQSLTASSSNTIKQNLNELSLSPRNSIDDYMRRDSINSSSNYEMDSHINKNLKIYNKLLITYLSSQGLNVNPLRLKQYKFSKGGILSSSTMKPTKNKSLQTFITGNGQLLFLPYNPAKKREQLVDGIVEDDEGDDDDSDNDDVDDNDDNNNNSTSNTNIHTTGHVSSSNVHHPHNVTNHTFGVIVKLSKSQTLNSTLKASYKIDALTRWPHGLNITQEDGRTKTVFRENYKVCHDMNWDLDMSNPDCFIPFNANTAAVAATSNNNSSSNNTNSSKTTTPNEFDDELNFDLDSESISTGLSSKASSQESAIVYSNEPSQQLRRLQLLHPKEFADERDEAIKNASSNTHSFNVHNINSKPESENLFKDSDRSSNVAKVFNPGYYIFLLPVVYPLTTPESVYTPSAAIYHRLNVQLEKSVIPAIPPPPSAFMSTSPIHTNKQMDHPTFSDFNSDSINNMHKEKKSTSFLKHLIGGGNNNSHNNNNNNNNKNDGLASTISNTLLSPLSSPSNSSPINTNGGNNSNKKNSNELYEFDYQLPVIRLPPSDATSTLNKSIYINKVWNDALNYEILLPKKYVQLSSINNINDNFMKQNQVILQMKIIPLVKSLCLKRIKINVTEKITYISKDKKFEKDNGSSDASGVKERSVTLLEIKTKDKGGTNALNTQIISGCVNNNLLTSCYNNGNLNSENSNVAGTTKNDSTSNLNSLSILRNRSRSNSGNLLNRRRSKSQPPFMDNGMKLSSIQNDNNNDQTDDIVITNPIKVQCPLIFRANNETGFIQDTYDNLMKGQGDINDGLIEENVDNFKDETISLFSSLSHNTYNNEIGSDFGFGNGNGNGDGDDETILSRSKSPPGKKMASLIGLASANSIPLSLSHNNGSYSSYNKENSINNNTTTTNNNNNNNNNSTTNNNNILTSSDNGFYPDVTFHNVKIRHRIQFCFRISKPDEKQFKEDGTPKMHHYEVIVDTPVIFVSPFCVSENLELPSYEYAIKSTIVNNEFIFKNFNNEDENDENDEYEISDNNNNNNNTRLPTFEQAMKATVLPSSPMMSQGDLLMNNNITNTRNRNFSTSSYLSQNEEELRSTTLLSTSPLSIDSGGSTLNMNLNFTRNGNNSIFNNLDQLIGSESSFGNNNLSDLNLNSNNNNKENNENEVGNSSKLSELFKGGMVRPTLTHIPTESSLRFSKIHTEGEEEIGNNNNNNNDNDNDISSSSDISNTNEMKSGLPSYETVMNEIENKQSTGLLNNESSILINSSNIEGEEEEEVENTIDDGYSINDTLNGFDEAIQVNNILK